MKRILALILTLALVLGCCPVIPVKAAAEEEEIIFEYEIEEGKVTITGYEGEYKTMAVPETLEGYPVTEIGEFCFAYAYSMESITIPDTVTRIGEYAFYNCLSLKTISLGTGVQELGEGAFVECNALASISVSAQNPYFSTDASGALYTKDQTQLLVVPGALEGRYTVAAGVKSISSNAFAYCRKLLDVILPDGLETIGDGAFMSCGYLVQLAIPASVKTIGMDAFTGCRNMKDLYYAGTQAQWEQIEIHEYNWNLEEMTVHYGEKAPEVSLELNPELYYSYTVEDGKATISSYDDTFEKEVVIPETLGGYPVVAIGEGAFYRLAVTSVTMNEGLLSIGTMAFGECSVLERVTFSNTLTHIGYSAFNLCRSLTEIDLPESLQTMEEQAFWQCSGLTEVTIPAGVQSMGMGVFMSCDNLTAIRVDPDNAAYSSDDRGVLFNKNKTILQEVPAAISGHYRMPEGVTEIARAAFIYCDELTGIDLPDSLTTIGQEAFFECTALKEIEIPDSVKAIDAFTFYCCRALNRVDIGEGVQSIAAQALDQSGCTSIVIGKGLASVAKYGFSGCKNLKDVYYTGTQEQWQAISIEKYNDSLVKATMHYEYERPEAPEVPEVPEYLNYVIEDGQAIIVGCDEAVSGDVIIPAQIEGCPVTMIDGGAFWYCENLTSVTIPDSVTTVGIDGFYGCPKLTGIWVSENNPSFSNDDRGVLFNKNKQELLYAPCGISGKYTVPDSVLTIGNGAFFGRDALTSVTLPEGLQSIDEGAFRECFRLGTVTIPASVTSIGWFAFFGCESMEAIQVADGNAYFSDDKGVLYNKQRTQLLRMPGGFSGDYTIPEGVQTIADYSLSYCYNLTAITIPNSVTAIGMGVFRDCDELTAVTIPENVQVLEEYLFDHCFKLSSVTIPAGVKNIKTGAFSDCDALSDVYYAGSKTQWDQVSIGEENEALKTATVHFGEGSSEISGTPGDLDGVNGVNVDDAIYLLQHVLMSGLFPITQAADYNKNGVADVDDAIYLLQHVLMPELFPLPESGSGNEPSGNEPGGDTDDDVVPDEKVKLSVGIPVSATVLDNYDNALTKWIEEECNVELEFVEYASGNDAASQIATQIVVQQKLPDILFGINLSDSVISQYGNDGYFQDLSDYYADKTGASKHFWNRMESELSEYEQKQVLNKITDPTSGGIYGVPVVETTALGNAQYQTWINQTWLDKLGLEKPTNLAELYQVLKAFQTQDPNGNGVADEIPLFGSQNVNGAKVVDWLINMFCYYNSGNPYNVGEDGKLYPVYTDDTYREALRFVNKLYKETLMSSLVFTCRAAEMKVIFTPASGTALCGIFVGDLDMCATAGSKVLYEYAPLQLWGCAAQKNITVTNNTYISADCENVDRAFQVLMKLWSWEGAMRVRYGEYGVNWVDADEGAKSGMGFDATYKLISDPLNKQNSAKWSKVASTLNAYSRGETAQADENADDWTKAKQAMQGEAYDNLLRAQHACNPEELCPTLYYTQDELEAMEANRANINTLQLRALNEFVMGQKDPNNDADWSAYLAELEELGLSIVMEYAQAAYQRQK